MRDRMARVFVVGLAVLAFACGGTTGVYKQDYAGSITLTLVNASPRPIESVFVHPIAKTDRGSSWIAQPIAPGASTTLKIREGGFELVAVSHERNIDAHNRETPEAMTMLEIRSDRGDQTLVFHDEGQTVAGLDKPSTVGVTFMVTQAPTP